MDRVVDQLFTDLQHAVDCSKILVELTYIFPGSFVDALNLIESGSLNAIVLEGDEPTKRSHLWKSTSSRGRIERLCEITDIRLWTCTCDSFSRAVLKSTERNKWGVACQHVLAAYLVCSHPTYQDEYCGATETMSLDEFKSQLILNCGIEDD